ncbi:MAG: hypothetical protein V9F04_01045 [Dermatophilaceae bacterium]
MRAARLAGPHLRRRTRSRRPHGCLRRAGQAEATTRPARSPSRTSRSRSTSRSRPATSSTCCDRRRGRTSETIALFDVYRGDQVGDGKKSLAFRLAFRAADRTLTTDEVSRCRDAAVAAAAGRFGAVQR